MYELRERNELCDVTLKVNNENFHAHKVRCYSFRLRPVPLTTNNRLLRANSLFPANLLSLPSATKLRRLCFYRRVSVHTGGCLPQRMLGYHTPPPQQTPLKQTTPPPPEQTPPRSRHTHTSARETATAADGTHPTGMHSCCSNVDKSWELKRAPGYYQPISSHVIASCKRDPVWVEFKWYLVLKGKPHIHSVMFMNVSVNLKIKTLSVYNRPYISPLTEWNPKFGNKF